MTTNTTAAAPPTSASPANAHGGSNQMYSTLTAILCLVALVTIPMILYVFFVAIKCPPRNRWRSTITTTARMEEDDELGCSKGPSDEHDSAFDGGGFMYVKADARGNEMCNDHDQCCAVCLSAFVEGEELKQLGACRHAFHAACIDAWLHSHANCPLCRARVAVPYDCNNNKKKRINYMSSAAAAREDDDFRQGLPDAANLI